jgi:hypothetical protein
MLAQQNISSSFIVRKHLAKKFTAVTNAWRIIVGIAFYPVGILLNENRQSALHRASCFVMT